MILLDFSVHSLLKRQSACAQRLIKSSSSQGDQVFLLPLELSPFLATFLGSCYKQCPPCLSETTLGGELVFLTLKLKKSACVNGPLSKATFCSVFFSVLLFSCL